MEPIYYHVSMSSVALEISPSWGHLENFSFFKTFQSRQSCKFCTTYHLQFDHLIIHVSQHQLRLQCSSSLCYGDCNAVPLCATPAWGRPRLVEIPQDTITGYIITALQVRELTQKSMKPITVLRSPVGSLQIQHSLQPYQSSTFLKSGNYILPNLTMWIGRLDQKCNLLQRWTKCTLYFWIHLST